MKPPRGRKNPDCPRCKEHTRFLYSAGSFSDGKKGLVEKAYFRCCHCAIKFLALRKKETT